MDHGQAFRSCTREIIAVRVGRLQGVWPCSCTGLHAQEHLLLGVECFMVAVLKYIIILSLDLHFVSEDQCNAGAWGGGSEPWNLRTLAQSGVIPLLYLLTTLESVICLLVFAPWRSGLCLAFPFLPHRGCLPLGCTGGRCLHSAPIFCFWRDVGLNKERLKVSQMHFCLRVG